MKYPKGKSPIVRLVISFRNLSIALVAAIPCVFSASISTASAGAKAFSPEHESLLWYAAPAKTWTEALPIGNGRLGAMVFGGITQERIQLNEDSLWSGRPEDANNPEAFAALPEIRRLLFSGRYTEAEKLAGKKLVCKGPGSVRGKGARGAYGSYQTLGDLLLDFDFRGALDQKTYKRELDLSQAIARVSFEAGGVLYQRELFASYPDQVIAIRLSANKPRALSFRAKLTRSEASKTSPQGVSGMLMCGQLWNGETQNGIKYAARLRAISNDGTIKQTGDGIAVENATEVLLLISAATDYTMELPNWRQGDPTTTSDTQITAAAKQTFTRLRNSHLLDYCSIYRRTILKVGPIAHDSRPTDKRLEALRAGNADPGLIALYFHFGRYLLIASSRKGDMPANLQGIWAEGIQNPWNADYHANINLQMNYWLAETANIPESFEPLDRYIAFLEKAGRATAKIHYGAKGWTVHTLANPWGFTAPGESPSWGLSPSAGAWCAQHLWEHFAFSRDLEYLRRIYPILQGSAEFSLDWLSENPESKLLVAGPATSPENKFATADGQRGSLCMGPSMEQQLVWDAFTNYLEAAQILGINDSTVSKVAAALARLAPPKIGSDGRLMEWPDEFKELEPGHRHISHLFALHPGRQITKTGTPELFAAARKSLERRLESGGGHTGWSRAWIINFWARLGDGYQAGKHLGLLLEKSTLPNLFDTHPPFQIDGNFGGVAGLCEMLVQSTQKLGQIRQQGTPEERCASYVSEITLLPAIPKEWTQGSITSLRARGGFETDIRWTDGALVAAQIRSGRGGRLIVRWRHIVATFDTKAGDILNLDSTLRAVNP